MKRLTSATGCGKIKAWLLNFQEILKQGLTGLEIIRWCRIHAPEAKLMFWNDPSGPEIDWVIRHPKKWIPLEVKYSQRPTQSDAKHLMTFMTEYPEAKHPIVICRSPRRMKLGEDVEAIPWTELHAALEEAFQD